MAGKQEHKPGVVIDYKNKLDDRFVDLATQKTTSEANEYLTQFNTNLHSENTQTVGSVSPYFYHSNARPGAKSPMSVEMAQHIFRNTLNALEDALRAEIARAFSSEKYLSDFMKENMVTKSEDQTISGFKKFDSVQVDHADIDTELVDEGTTNDLTVRNRLQIPLGAPQTRKTGDIWYDANITSPGGTSGGTDTGKQVTVHQYSTNEVAMYDGSTHVATFTADSAINEIELDDKTIKIPNGVILGNMNGSNSINLEKNALNNTVKFSVNNDYVDELASIQAHALTDPLDTKVDNLIIETKANVDSLETEIDGLNNDLNSKTNDLNSKLDSKSSSINQRIDNFSQEQSIINSDTYTRLQTIFNDIDQVNTRITNQETDQNSKYSALSTSQDEILGRLLEIDGDTSSSLKNQVASLIDGLSTLSTEITKIKDKINSIHGAGTI